MSSYVVLARKYRPQTFADLVGQQHIAKTLQNAIRQNRVAHAFLFTGSRGVGKTSSARIFAKTLNCECGPCDEPCNKCKSCIEITESRSIDVIEMDAASNRGIGEIQEILESARYAPTRDRYKIFIIDEVHMLTNEAFNALLKTLEEPPAHVKFIFATTDPNKIPVTILSRCQRYDFKRIPVDDLVAHLKKISTDEKIPFDDASLRLIARNAHGGVRDSLSAMDQIIAFSDPPVTEEQAATILGVASRETLVKFVIQVLERNVAEALRLVREIDAHGQDMRVFAYDVLETIRDITVIASDKNAGPYVELDANEQARALEALVSTGTTNDRLQRIFNIWYEAADKLLPKSLTPRLLLEMTTIRMCQTESVIPIDNILRRLDFLAQTITQGGAISPDALEKAKAFLASQTGGVPTLWDSSKKTDAAVATASAAENHVAPKNIDSRPNIEVSKREVEAPQAEGVAAYLPAANSRVGGDFPPPQKKPELEPPPLSEFKPENRSAVTTDPLAPEDSLMAMYEAMSEEPEITDDVMNALRDADFSINPDDEEDADDEDGGGYVPQKLVQSQKSLAVLNNGLKRFDPAAEEAAVRTRWKTLVSNMKVPLSKMLAHAVVKKFDSTGLEISLSDAFSGIFSSRYEEEITQEIRQLFKWSVRCKVAFTANADESSTLAAEEARAELARQEKQQNALIAHTLYQAVLGCFHLEPSSVRFTFNSDRNS